MTAKMDWTRVVVEGLTVEDVIAEAVADPEFVNNPTSFIGRATSMAVDSFVHFHPLQSRFYTGVGLGLCEAAGVTPGAQLHELGSRRW